ncbi:uncharacterized protein LOC123307237 [Coccinella septempunctata]|uniref:uncharacterized protein LOC123307237 n=1 Tax=Coccinella septempunctata TaxID=41139 RepID=UPI001D0854C3|nr:uncharacterized protein LOC123307237 [Coccinella septempunctata]
MFPQMEKALDDVKLIRCVKNRPALYDPSHVKYMDLYYKNGLWNEISEELKVDSIACKTRWGNIRDNFRKSLKKTLSKRTMGGKLVKHYKYSDQLQFLRKMFDGDELGDGLGERHILPGVEVKIEDDSLTRVDFQEPFSDDESQCSSPVQTAQKRKTTNLDYCDQTHSSANSSPQHFNLLKFDQRPGQSESQSANFSPHPVDAFLAGLVPTLKTFSPLNWHLAKSEIFAVVQKYELKTIMGEGNEQSSLT